MKVQHNGVTVVLFDHEPFERLNHLSIRQLDYRRFLATPQWDELRSECYNRANRRCSKCRRSGVQLNAHHKTYPDRFEDTTQEHLECVCRDCHKEEHGISVRPRKTLAKPKKNRVRGGRKLKLDDIKTYEELLAARSAKRLTRAQFIAGKMRFGFKIKLAPKVERALVGINFKFLPPRRPNGKADREARRASRPPVQVRSGNFVQRDGRMIYAPL